MAAAARGDGTVARDALLAKVFDGKATHEEQRLARELTDHDPVGSALRPGVTASPADHLASAADAPRMTLFRDDQHGHPVARLIGTEMPADRAAMISPWRSGWERLPRSLAEQLSVCVLTRVARVNGVAEITAAEPSTEPVAAAISVALRRAGERHAEGIR